MMQGGYEAVQFWAAGGGAVAWGTGCAGAGRCGLVGVGGEGGCGELRESWCSWSRSVSNAAGNGCVQNRGGVCWCRTCYRYEAGATATVHGAVVLKEYQ